MPDLDNLHEIEEIKHSFHQRMFALKNDLDHKIENLESESFSAENVESLKSEALSRVTLMEESYDELKSHLEELLDETKLEIENIARS